MDNRARNKQITREFFVKWGVSFDSMIESFRERLATNCLLRMTRTPDLNGIEEIVIFMDRVREAGIIEIMEVEVRRMVAEDDCVVCERIDTMRNNKGEVLAVFPTFSVMDFVDGKIVEWHDYFDSADMPMGSATVVAQGAQ